MLNENKMSQAELLIGSVSNSDSQKVKLIRKDPGLLERKECDEKIILVEDNRQVLFG